MRFQIDPRPGEALRGCGALAREVMPESRFSVIMIAVYFGTIAAAYYLAYATWATTVGISIAAIMATIAGVQLEGRRRLRALRGKDPHETETHFVELSAEGIHTWCGHVDARYPWREFVKATENGEFYLFVRASGSGAAIPKRILSDAENDELRTRIRDWAPDRGASLARVIEQSASS